MNRTAPIETGKPLHVNLAGEPIKRTHFEFQVLSGSSVCGSGEWLPRGNKPCPLWVISGL